MFAIASVNPYVSQPPLAHLRVSERQPTVPHPQMVHHRDRLRCQHLSVHVQALEHQLAAMGQVPVQTAHRPVHLDLHVVVVQQRHLRHRQLAERALLQLQHRAPRVVRRPHAEGACETGGHARAGLLGDEAREVEGLEAQVGEAGDAALPGEVALENAGVLQVVDAEGDDVAQRVVGDEVARVANHAEAVVGVGDGDEQVLLTRDLEEA